MTSVVAVDSMGWFRPVTNIQIRDPSPRPSMRALLAVALLLVPLAAGGGLTPPAREGDAAEYRLDEDGRARTVYLEWRTEEVWLPTGSLARLPTLRAVIADADDARAQRRTSLLNPFLDDGLVPASLDMVALHWTDQGGAPVAWSASWLDRADGDARWVTRTTMARCAPQAEFLLWADPGCGAAVQRTRSDRLALPERVEGDGWTLTLTAMRHGDAPLTDGELLPRATPRVRMVTWDTSGPLAGDLGEHSFRSAHEALLAQDETAARFFATNPDARVLHARHAWSTALASSSDPWRDRVKGVPCVTSSAERAEGMEWSQAWVAQRGSLFALTQRMGLPIERVVATNADGYAERHLGGPPARSAPAPRDLAAHLSLIPVSRGEVATLEIDLLPSGAMGSISRGTCVTDPTTGVARFTGGSVTFVDGMATSTMTMEAERERPGLPLGLASVASTSPIRAPSAPSGLSPVVVASATLAGLALAALAVGLYSRIARDRALAHPTRARVHAFVCAAPGQSIQGIARGVGLPRNTVEHHVRALERHGYVRVEDGPAGKWVAPVGEATSFEPLLARQHVPQLLAIVRASPGLTQAELAARLGMRKGHLSELLGELERAGTITREREGRVSRVRATDGSGRS